MYLSPVAETTFSILLKEKSIMAVSRGAECDSNRMTSFQEKVSKFLNVLWFNTVVRIIS
jgi:hypothetical protein